MQIDMKLNLPSMVALAHRALTAKFKLDPLDEVLLALALVQGMLAGNEADDETLIELSKEAARVSGLMVDFLVDHYADKGIRL